MTSEIEDAVSTLSGLENVQSQSQENLSLVMLELEYGTDMDRAHMDLQENLNTYASSLPDTASDPIIVEISMARHGHGNPIGQRRRQRRRSP